MTDLAGRTVVITGAASGIGRRIALLAADRGATVVGWDLNQAGLDALVDELQTRIPGRAHGYQVNVADKDAVAAAGRVVLDEVGPVDVVVNNAGVVSGALISDLTDNQIERTFDVNVLALFWVTRAFLPQMMKRGSGHVVTVASAAGLLGVVRQTDYSASKHAAVGFDESLRVEMRRYAPGVKTTLVCPFYINTGMFDVAKSRVPFLLPILDEGAVAKGIVNAIEKNRARLVLPSTVGLVPLLRALPVSVFDVVMDVLGINKSMDEFAGRRPKDESGPATLTSGETSSDAVPAAAALSAARAGR